MDQNTLSLATRFAISAPVATHSLRHRAHPAAAENFALAVMSVVFWGALFVHAVPS